MARLLYVDLNRILKDKLFLVAFVIEKYQSLYNWLDT